eukprot:TRINITY_DN1954_c0_g3_i1.p1 TRINITY_DN1954_c0_g3~~TRINITY_DN1954_c0_g3_i1.p1  ORF type:complete len:303 (+),score=12.91 TRINITY_DN1954_c0_g3_i1:55-909(+)
MHNIHSPWEKSSLCAWAILVCSYTPVFCVYLLILGVNYPALLCTGYMGMVQTGVTIQLVLLLLVSYSRCVWTDPGGVGDEWKHAGHAEQGDINFAFSDKRIACHELKENGDPRYCKTCEVFKPDRTHHCSACGRCILKMDHHCVFVNNCIGHRNHKYFILFLFYIVLDGAWLGATLSTRYIAAKSTFRNVLCHALLLLSSVIGTVFAIVLFFFLAFHLYLVVSNQTTIDLSFRTPVTYRRGTLTANIQASLGKDGPLFWFLPLKPSLPTGDNWMREGQREAFSV